ncbi:MAG: T9SS type A sorting domain-containing protein [Bacteroidota bacterium]
MKHLFKIYCVIFHFIIHAQPPSKFYQRFGGNGYDVGYDVKQTLDSGYIITGSTSSFGFGNTDLYVAKLDKMGQIKFQKSFGNFNNECGKSIVQLIDSSYVMLGYTNSSGFGGYDIYLVKMDKNGNLLWQKNYGGSDWDFGNSLQKTSDGGFIIAGTTYSFGRGDADGYIIKTDALGNAIWTKTYGGINKDEFKSVIQTADGGYALTGYTKSYLDNAFGDVWTFKLDALGDSVWCKFYGGVKEDFGNCIVELKNANILISGGTKSSSIGGNFETLLVTYSISSSQVYNYIDVSSRDEYYNSVTQNVKGSIANCGTSKNPTFNYDALVDIYTSSYGYLNFFGVGDLKVEEFFSISKTKDKGFVAVGKTSSYGAVLEDVFFMKMDSVGNFGLSYTSLNNYSFNNYGSVEVFPNPSNGIINISIGENLENKKMNYSVLDVKGEIIFSDKLNESMNLIKLENISNGLYFIKIYDSLLLIKTVKISVTNN